RHRQIPLWTRPRPHRQGPDDQRDFLDRGRIVSAPASVKNTTRLELSNRGPDEARNPSKINTEARVARSAGERVITQSTYSPSRQAAMASVRTAILAAALMLAPAIACAETRLDARYAVTLAGVTIGKGAWIVDIGEDQYTAAASGATTGLIRLFAS